MKRRFLLITLAAAALSGQTARETEQLADGVYAVLSAGAAGEKPRTLIYSQKYSEADRSAVPRPVVLEAGAFVPLELAEPPEAREDERGNTLLRVRLAPRHVKTLEDFTRRYLEKEVAVVIAGEIITMHKVRAVIRDGDVTITRCRDNACETLKMKLTR